MNAWCMIFVIFVRVVLNSAQNVNIMPSIEKANEFELDRAREFIENLRLTLRKPRPRLGPGSVFFYCINPKNLRTQEVVLDDRRLRSKLDLNKKVALIIHGWMTSANDQWNLKLAKDWATFRDYNVCRVQWANHAFTEYFNSLTNLPVVGDVVSEFVLQLLRNRFNLNNIVCVGHGVGAHMCGHIGANFNGRMSKIIGLDPAGLGFTIPVVAPQNFRLDRSDAHLVMAIHSGDFGIGSRPYYPAGHQDFYINGGMTMTQRGCGPIYFVNPIYNSTELCAHFRAVQIFHKSLLRENSDCIAKSCTSIWKYFARLCYGPVDKLGLDSKGISGEFYMATNEAPRCTGEFYLF